MAVPIIWRTNKQRYSLHSEVCPVCSKAVFPPRKVCPYCNQESDALYATNLVENGQRQGVVFALPMNFELDAVGDD